jgi:hypothetical protein
VARHAAFVQPNDIPPRRARREADQHARLIEDDVAQPASDQHAQSDREHDIGHGFRCELNQAPLRKPSQDEPAAQKPEHIRQPVPPESEGAGDPKDERVEVVQPCAEGEHARHRTRQERRRVDSAPMSNWPDSLPLFAAVQLAALGLLAAGLAWTLRVAGAPGGRHGAAVLGGLVAGILLGPAVLGNVAPDLRERMFIGAVQSREELRQAERQSRIDIEALRAIDASPAAIDEAILEQAASLAPLQTRAEQELQDHRDALALALTAIICASLLVAAPLLRRGLPRRDDEESMPLSTAVPAGALATVAAMLLPMAIAVALMRLDRPAAVGFAACCAIPGLGIALGASTWRICAVAIVLLAAVLGWLLRDGPTLLVAISGAMVAAVCIGPWLASWRRAALGISTAVVVPLLCAWAMARCDPQLLVDSRIFWIGAFVGILLASDGRWVAIALARRFFAPSATQHIWTRSAAAVNAGAGVASLITALLLHWEGIMSADVLAAVLVGVLTIETTRSVRPRLARMLDGAGSGLDHDRG